VRLDCRDTGLAPVTRSSTAEWTRSAGACVTPLILQGSFAEVSGRSMPSGRVPVGERLVVVGHGADHTGHFT